MTIASSSTRHTFGRDDDRISVFSSRGPTWHDGFAKPGVAAPGQSLVSVMWSGDPIWGQHIVWRTSDPGGGSVISSGATWRPSPTTMAVPRDGDWHDRDCDVPRRPKAWSGRRACRPERRFPLSAWGGSRVRRLRHRHRRCTADSCRAAARPPRYAAPADVRAAHDRRVDREDRAAASKRHLHDLRLPRPRLQRDADAGHAVGLDHGGCRRVGAVHVQEPGAESAAPDGIQRCGPRNQRARERGRPRVVRRGQRPGRVEVV